MSQHLSFRTSLKMGLHGFIERPIRLAFTILVTVISLVFLGSALTAYLFNGEAQKQAFLKGKTWVLTGNFSTENFNKLQEETKATCYPLGVEEIYYELSYFFGEQDRYDSAYRAQGVTSADETFLKEHGFSIVGRLPKENDEVAISKHLMANFLRCGYYDHITSPKWYDMYGKPVYEKKYEYEVSSAEDFVLQDRRLNLTFNNQDHFYCVVGVVDDGCKEVHDDTWRYVPSVNDLFYLTEEELIGLYPNGMPYALTPVWNENTYSLLSALEGIGAIYSSEYDVFMQALRMVEENRTIFLSVGLALLVFTVILIYQFMSFSMDSKRRQIAILRALGATKIEMANVFLLEAGVLGAVQAILSYGGMAILFSVFNRILKDYLCGITVFLFSSITIVVIFAFSICVSLLSALIPILQTVNKSPIEAIQENGD